MSTSSSPSSSTAPGSTPVDVFELGSEHEQVVFCTDEATGLRAIVAIHSTALGPALGGTRFYPYASTDAAVRDVLDLSRGMTYKAAVAGLDLGGGKAVILGDPATLKTEALLRAYGRFVQSLGGRYRTACDIGTFSPDMDHVARECDFVTGRTVATDVHGPAVDAVLAEHPGVRAVASTEALVAAALDVYAPCAMGGAITDEVVDTLSAKIVCGAANNQLAHPGVEKHLMDAGITYAPDYVVNAGGLIQVADELDPRGFSFERAQQRASGILETTRRILALADDERVSPAVAADRIAEERIRTVGRLRSIWVG